MSQRSRSATRSLLEPGSAHSLTASVPHVTAGYNAHSRRERSFSSSSSSGDGGGPNEVAAFLASIQLHKYIRAFAENNIDEMRILRRLAESDMKEIGVTIGDKYRIGDALESSAASNAKSSAVASSVSSVSAPSGVVSQHSSVGATLPVSSFLAQKRKSASASTQPEVASNMKKRTAMVVARLNEGSRKKFKFSCQVVGCGYTAKKNSALVGHARTHTGERPFKCDAVGCDFACAFSNSLIMHRRRIHTGERPFKCDAVGCGYACADSGSLVRHHRTHTGERPFKCSAAGCGFACSQSSYLAKHFHFKHQRKHSKM